MSGVVEFFDAINSVRRTAQEVNSLRNVVGAAGDAAQHAPSTAPPSAAGEVAAKQASLQTTRGKLLTLYEFSSVVLFPGATFLNLELFGIDLRCSD